MQSAPREAPPNKSVKLVRGPAGEWHEVGRWGFQSGLILFLFDRWGDPQTSKVLTLFAGFGAPERQVSVFSIYKASKLMAAVTSTL